MANTITRDEALTFLEDHVKNPNMIKHCLASEAVLRALAVKLDADADKWALAGLLHDLDAEITKDDFHLHGKTAAELLEAKGLDREICDAVLMHNEAAAGKLRETIFHHALAAGETITGLIVATTLVYPDKKLASVKPKSILKRMKTKAFAASVNRDTIRECEKTGIPLDEFAALALEAMQGISDDLGL